jgi:hypothetical protein
MTLALLYIFLANIPIGGIGISLLQIIIMVTTGDSRAEKGRRTYISDNLKYA